jgi:hypothetical protein
MSNGLLVGALITSIADTSACSRSDILASERLRLRESVMPGTELNA